MRYIRRVKRYILFPALSLVVEVLIRFPRVDGCLASPHPFQMKQPDGNETPPLWIHGDPLFRYLSDDQGFTVMQDGKNQVVYAMRDPSTLCMIPSGMMVGEDDPQKLGIERGVFPDAKQQQELCGRMCEQYDDNGNPTSRLSSTSQPSSARVSIRKNLVILIRFSNHRNRRLPTAGAVGVLFNKKGGDPVLAPTGSIRDVYLRSSYGKFTLESTVYGWVNVKKTEQYYADGNSGLTNVFVEALHEALDLIDANPNFSFRDFDSDGDGTVDALTILHSGYGAEWGGTDSDGHSLADRIWSHKWTLRSSQHWRSREGIRVNKYNVNPSLWGLRGATIGRIGVISHELGHILGLPDLYDGVPLDGVSGAGIGSYGLMSNSWGFDGSQFFPPIMSPWSKIQVGWLEPKVIVIDGTYRIDASALEPDVYLIDLGAGRNSNEYLLIENRQRISYDSKLPQGGLAIWHIDEEAGHRKSGFPGQSGWPRNGNHYRVALLQADGRYHMETGQNRGDEWDLFHRNGVNSIGPSISLEQGPFPNTDSYQGGIITRTGIRIHSISRAGPAMTFSVALNKPTPKPTRSPTPMPTPIPTRSPTPRPTKVTPHPTNFPRPGSRQRELVTTFRGGNGAPGCMFDVKPHRNVLLHGLDIHTDSKKSLFVQLWTKPGTHSGFETDIRAWTKVTEAVIQGAGVGNRSPLPMFKPVHMQAKQMQAFYVAIRTGGDVRYTNGKKVGTIYASNADMQVYEGVGKSSFFGDTYPERQWNGVLHYSIDEYDTTLPPTNAPSQKPSPFPTPLPTQRPTRRPSPRPTPRPTSPPSPRPTVLPATNAIVTTFQGGSEQAGNMFDLVPFRDITVTGIDIHTSFIGEVTVEIWTKTGSHKGFETECVSWNRVGVVTVLGAGRGKPTPLPVNAIDPVPILRFHIQAFYVTIRTTTGKGMRYTPGSGRGRVVAYDANVAILEGVGKSYPCGSTFLNRIFNGVLHYAQGINEMPLLPTPPPAPQVNDTVKELRTTFVGGKTSAGCMFDVIPKRNISIVGVRLNVDTMSQVAVELWTKVGTHVGFDKSPYGWTKVLSGKILGRGRGQESPLKSRMDSIAIVGKGEKQAFYVTLTVNEMRYSDGKHFTEAGSNSDLVVAKGVGKSYPFGTTYQDRVFNGVLLYVVENE